MDKLPDTIRILALDIKIVEEPPGEFTEDSMGRSSLMRGQITLRKDLPEGIKMQTLLHEIIHMIASMNDLELNDSEVEVSTLASGLLALFRDNPGLARQFSGEGPAVVPPEPAYSQDVQNRFPFLRAT